MAKEAEEANKSRKHEFILTNPDWLDLPEPIATNIILEHLEIVDYVRFSAVCKKWYSIQKEHRILYSPNPPPFLLPFPWLICRYCLLRGDGKSIHFHLPDKQKSYNIPVPSVRTFEIVRIIGYGHDCFLLKINSAFKAPLLHIFNPITGVLIKLPPFPRSKSTFDHAYISSALSDSNCTLLIESRDCKVYLYGLNNNNNCSWRKVDRCSKMMANRTAFCNNKFFRMDLHCCYEVFMIDTLLSDPVEQLIKMDISVIHQVPSHHFWSTDLVDFFGELVVILAVLNEHPMCPDHIEEFHVYRAEFSTNKWVRMETLGDGVLFFSSVSAFASNTFALRAADIGCKKNTIYSAEGCKDHRVAWRAFDLSSRDWINGLPLLLSNGKYHSICPPKSQENSVSWSWFRPSLNYFNGANTNRNSQNICLDA